jgi:hypothetical protein
VKKQKEVEYIQISEDLWKCSRCGCHIRGGLGVKIDGPDFHFIDSKCFCGGLIKRVKKMKQEVEEK